MTTIGVTLGDPCGIGPELVRRVLPKLADEATRFQIYGPDLELERIPGSPQIRKIPTSSSPAHGFRPEDRRARGEATVAMLNRASDDALRGDVQALVTGPIDKTVVRTSLPKFTGHTGHLAERAGVPRTVMMLDNQEMRVVLITQHIPLRDVSKALTVFEFEETLRVTVEGLRGWFGFVHPRIAVAGVNPHAGELVPDGEEATVLTPVITRLQKEGWNIEGPFAADTLFPMARSGKWDVLISPYHDQGLVAAKYPGLDKVVNITLGLPYLRVSPGHGVAYDKVGTDLIDTRSFERAVHIAQTGRLA